MSTEKKTPEIEDTGMDAITGGSKRHGVKQAPAQDAEKEIGGFKDAGLPEPTRFGDWEVNGRCSDF